MDNHATRKTPAIQRWHVHFTPTGASWLDQVERFFAALTEKQLRRAVHRATREPEQAIRDHIDTVNANPRPFRWTRSADDILATIKRFCLRTLDTAQRQKKISKTWKSGHYGRSEQGSICRQVAVGFDPLASAGMTRLGDMRLGYKGCSERATTGGFGCPIAALCGSRTDCGRGVMRAHGGRR